MSLLLFRSESINLPAEPRIHRDDGEGLAVLQSGRVWLAAVTPVEGKVDDGVLAMGGADRSLYQAVPRAHIAVLDVAVDCAAAVAV